MTKKDRQYYENLDDDSIHKEFLRIDAEYDETFDKGFPTMFFDTRTCVIMMSECLEKGKPYQPKLVKGIKI